MRYCKKCVQPDTRPGIYFDENGVCGACLYQEEIKSIDWDDRRKKLDSIVKWAKAKANNYDCAIGVSGGKDSTLQALYARDVLGLRSLLINSEPDDITEIGRHNIENLKNLGFDSISIRPNSHVMKKLIRKDFYRYLNPVKVTEYSLWASAYIAAKAFKIPLIIQGENAGLTLGTRHKTGTDDDSLNVTKLDTLEKGCLSEYVGDGVEPKDLFVFHFDPDSLRRDGIRGIWLQYYLREWSQPNNAAFAIAHGLWIRPENVDLHGLGTYRRYSQLDGRLLEVNQMLKYIKLGFGQATDHACYDIRDGHITRDEGISLVREFDGKCGEEYIRQFCSYVGMSSEEFWKVADSFRGKMWEKNSRGEWRLKDPIWEQEPSKGADTKKIIKLLDKSLAESVLKRKEWFEKLKSHKPEMQHTV